MHYFKTRVSDRNICSNGFFLFVLFLLIICFSCKGPQVKSFEDFGTRVNSGEDANPAVMKMLEFLGKYKGSRRLVIRFPEGRYDFYAGTAPSRNYYISNHDHEDERKVVFPLEHLKNVVIDGQGSEFIFHGRMIPFSVIGSQNITFRNFSIDYAVPHLRQLNVLEVHPKQGYFIGELYPHGDYRIEGGKLWLEGPKFELQPHQAMAFSADGRLTYLRRDLEFNPEKVEEVSPNFLKVYEWQLNETQSGEQFVLRTYYRPTPGIFVSQSLNTRFDNVKVHYAEGMGLLAQMSENIYLDGFSVSLKEGDRRCFTTQADATHFSGCKGEIISINGLYEGMADDAINVHGTYLKTIEVLDEHTLVAAYMHSQSWGFEWGMPGDSVQFLVSNTMEIKGALNRIQTIEPFQHDQIEGAKMLKITFENPLPGIFFVEESMVVENLTWTPEVVFSHNTVRNNRARGALFSTPKKVVCEENLFDHSHGTAILLCGDANGWYETGACRDVLIRNNTFRNNLTAYYQFTNAIISIFPVIPELEKQEAFFHSGIVIENNRFETFDQPVLYARSTENLVFRNNIIFKNRDYEPFHWNQHVFLFEKVKRVLIEDNKFEQGFDSEKDIRALFSEPGAVVLRNE